jgi:hypothetical protein
LWRKDDSESLLKLMRESVTNRAGMAARLPRFSADDNTRKLADDVETACGRELQSKTTGRPSNVVAGS